MYPELKKTVGIFHLPDLDLKIDLLSSFSLLTVTLNFTVRLHDIDILHGVYLTAGMNRDMSLQHVEDSLTMTAGHKRCSNSYILYLDVSLGYLNMLP